MKPYCLKSASQTKAFLIASTPMNAELVQSNETTGLVPANL